MIEQDFRTLLLTLLPAGPTDVGGVDLSSTSVEKGRASVGQGATRVQYQRSEANQDVAVDGTPLLAETAFDVECYALDEPTAQALATALKSGPRTGTRGTNGYSGKVGATWIHGAFAQDHSDDYQPKLLDADEGYSVATFRVMVVHEDAA